MIVAYNLPSLVQIVLFCDGMIPCIRNGTQTRPFCAVTVMSPELLRIALAATLGTDSWVGDHKQEDDWQEQQPYRD
jgi:hypothetical protein